MKRDQEGATVGVHIPGAAVSEPIASGRSRVSVCVATRNRGARIAPLLESLKSLEHDSFEVIVVDQSTDDETKLAYYGAVRDDKRFSYIASRKIGKPLACNLAVARATGSIIAFTDDDCVARSDWLSGIERAFATHPGVGVICGGVVAGEYDPDKGYIPVFTPTRARVHRSRWALYRVSMSLMGANIAFGADALRAVGGFDEAVGPGAPFRSGDDYDIVYRLLRAGHALLVLPGSAIVHYGFRAHGVEMQALTRDCSLGHGAVGMKYLRLADPAILPALTVWLVGDTIQWANLVRLRGPTGLGRLLAFATGMAHGFRHPLDRTSRTYASRSEAEVGSHRSPVRPSGHSPAS
jgi:hypothetical protein